MRAVEMLRRYGRALELCYINRIETNSGCGVHYCYGGGVYEFTVPQGVEAPYKTYLTPVNFHTPYEVIGFRECDNLFICPEASFDMPLFKQIYVFKDEDVDNFRPAVYSAYFIGEYGRKPLVLLPESEEELNEFLELYLSLDRPNNKQMTVVRSGGWSWKSPVSM
jgi:hypothetical protein